MKIVEKAPAKINLSLDILGKREDGYHEVEMIMTTIDLADRIHLTLLDTPEIRMVTSSRQIPNDKRNLAYAAAAILNEKCGTNYGVEIEIEKNIPVAAGLAGGSSDAAATLRGLNKLWNLGLTIDELAEIGAEIGSDVPFCVYGGTALATGRGEKIRHISTPPNCWVILEKPPISVSTEECYKGYNADKVEHPNTQAMIDAIEANDFDAVCNEMGNVLESVTLKRHPEVQRIKDKMAEFGVDAVMMSGSGPTVFGLVKHDSRMHRVYNGLRGFCNQVHAVRILGERYTD